MFGLRRNPETTEAYLAHKRRQRFLAETGRPSLVKGDELERVLRKVRVFHARGMSFPQMSDQLGGDPNSHTIAESLSRPGRRGMRRTTWVKLLPLTFEEPADHIRVPGLGTKRRLAGLWYGGYPLPLVSELLGIGPANYFQKMIAGVAGWETTAGTARAVAALADKLETADPADYGIDSRKRKYCRAFAIKKGCAPLGCWDVDTIDDPEAIPEWTGACGTELGPSIHKRESIPLCEACKAVGRPTSRKFSGEKLRDLRVQHGWSQGALERRLGLGKGHVHHWEDAKYGPSGARLEALLSLLDVTFEEISEEEV